MELVIAAFFPAFAMTLIGVISAGSARRSLILFAVCAIWVAAGIIVLFADYQTLLPGILCFAEAATGFLAWLFTVLKRMNQAAPYGRPASEPPSEP